MNSRCYVLYAYVVLYYSIFFFFQDDENVVSTQKTLRATQDPGWNDPPKWAFAPTPNPGNTPTKRLLNKRIAFPLNSTSSPSIQPPTVQILPFTNLPPPSVQATNLATAPHAPILTPSRATTDISVVESPINQETALNNTLEMLQAVLVNADFKENSKMDEVQRRLDMMTVMWKENRFNCEIQGKILNISKGKFN